MGEGSHEREHLGALIEENSRLAKEAWQKSHELEQLLAARKDAVRAGARRATGPVFQGVATAPLHTNGSICTQTGHPTAPSTSRERCPVLILVEDNPDDFT